jgi:hypothetical protein
MNTEMNIWDHKRWARGYQILKVPTLRRWLLLLATSDDVPELSSEMIYVTVHFTDTRETNFTATRGVTHTAVLWIQTHFYTLNNSSQRDVTAVICCLSLFHFTTFG